MSYSEQEIEEFKVEALEMLDTAEKSLLDLDEGGDFKPAFDATFRSFHNLKGGAGMMELIELQRHTHELENILMPFKEKSLMPKEYISFFLKGIDAARLILEGEKIEFNYTVEGVGLESQQSNKNQTIPHETHHEEPMNELAQNNSINTAIGFSFQNKMNKSEVSAIPDTVIAEFIAECDEIVERVSLVLQKIENLNYSKEDLEALYRDMHSLKGSAFLFSFQSLGTLTHSIESSLEPIRSQTHTPSSELINILFDLIKVIENEIKSIRNKDQSSITQEVIQFYTKKLNFIVARLKPISMNEEDQKKIGSLAEINTQINKSEQTQVLLSSTGDAIIETHSKLNEEKETKKLSVVKSENSIGNPPSQGNNNSNKDKEDANTSIRVPVSLLDSLMTLIGEMVLVRNQVIQYASRSDNLEFVNLSKRLNVVTSEIQGEMMKTRMQPVGNVLTKFNRVVRDLSQDLKKEINLTLFGAETELDKSLLESIKDPLTHIVRNSCDHGIENPEVRLQNGKPRQGTISIKSYHEGGQVVIEVSDDGKGLHKEMLIKKAIEKGIINQQQASTLSDKETFNLIFAPGFSTAATITNVSGRGVGMDVVRTNVEKIGGTVDLESVAGKGTVTKLKIPLTLAIVPALIVRSSNNIFAIPQVKLEELVRVDNSSTENKIEFLQGTPVYRLRGHILPLVYLNQVCRLNESEEDRIKSIKNIAVVNAEHCAFGLVVDEVQDTADIVVKPINKLLKSLNIYSGATILGDGSIALILDIMGIAKSAQISSEQNNKVSASEIESKSSEMQDFLIVSLSSETKHAIVLNYVNRLEEFNLNQVEKSGPAKVIRYGQHILPLLSVNEFLGYPDLQDKQKQKQKVSVVVIKKAGLLYGLVVNEIVDTFTTDIELDTTMTKQKGILGNINAKDSLIVAIDPYEIIEHFHPESKTAPVVGSTDLKIVGSQTINNESEKHKLNKVNTKKDKLNILVVEDTPFFRKAINKVLIKEGHNVYLANDGLEALEMIEKLEGQLDLILSDIEMPRMNGFELAIEVRKHPVFSHIPMLACSSRADKQYLDQGMKAGFNIYLEKLKPEILIEAISKLTGFQGAA